MRAPVAWEGVVTKAYHGTIVCPSGYPTFSVPAVTSMQNQATRVPAGVSVVRRKKSKKQEIRENIVQQSRNSAANKRYQTSISREFNLPTDSRRSKSSAYEYHQTSALDFDALPNAERRFNSRPKLRRATLSETKAEPRATNPVAIHTNGLKTEQNSTGSSLPAVTNMERVEIICMSVLATVVTDNEVPMGYWMKKIAFIFWAVILLIVNRISAGSDAFWVRGSSMQQGQLYYGAVSFIWLMMGYLYIPSILGNINFAIQTACGVVAFVVSYILHSRGTFKGLVSDINARKLRLS